MSRHKEVIEILRTTFDRPGVIEITDSLLDEYPELKTDSELD
jgi:hypothetical protein